MPEPDEGNDDSQDMGISDDDSMDEDMDADELPVRHLQTASSVGIGMPTKKVPENLLRRRSSRFRTSYEH